MASAKSSMVASPAIRAVIVMDTDGVRVHAKYYAKAYETKEKQVQFQDSSLPARACACASMAAASCSPLLLSMILSTHFLYACVLIRAGGIGKEII